jgi:hypothetical protein
MWTQFYSTVVSWWSPLTSFAVVLTNGCKEKHKIIKKLTMYEHILEVSPNTSWHCLSSVKLSPGRLWLSSCSFVIKSWGGASRRHRPPPALPTIKSNTRLELPPFPPLNVCIQNYSVFGLCSSSGILNTRIYDVLETIPVSKTLCFLVCVFKIHDGWSPETQ